MKTKLWFNLLVAVVISAAVLFIRAKLKFHTTHIIEGTPSGQPIFYNELVGDGFYATDFPGPENDYRPLSEEDKNYAELVMKDPLRREAANAR